MDEKYFMPASTIRYIRDAAAAGILVAVKNVSFEAISLYLELLKDYAFPEMSEPDPNAPANDDGSLATYGYEEILTITLPDDEDCKEDVAELVKFGLLSDLKSNNGFYTGHMNSAAEMLQRLYGLSFGDFPLLTPEINTKLFG
ncbi:hypothetical protein FACS1894120_5180 [Clostridia bacterium]|nr:hypothetical protein FACS1894120_5180 [Clostridia bacterium]